MGRIKTTPATPPAPPVLAPKRALALAAAQDQAVRAALAPAQTDQRVRALAAQLGYQLPADCTDPDLIQRDISANMRRSVEACLEVGRGLRVLKEACEHGQFVARLDVLGIDRHVAARFIQAATKFSNVPSTAHLTAAIGNQTKLFEMLVLDDEQLEELELSGQTGNLALDDIATMSVKELRAALRQARQDNDFTGQKLQKARERADQLERAQRQIADLPPDEVLQTLLQGVAERAAGALGAVQGPLRQGFAALAGHHAAHGGDSREVMAGYVAQIARLLLALREEFALPDAVGDGRPAWQVWSEQQEAQEQAGAIAG